MATKTIWLQTGYVTHEVLKSAHINWLCRIRLVIQNLKSQKIFFDILQATLLHPTSIHLTNSYPITTSIDSTSQTFTLLYQNQNIFTPQIVRLSLSASGLCNVLCPLPRLPAACAAPTFPFPHRSTSPPALTVGASSQEIASSQTRVTSSTLEII